MAVGIPINVFIHMAPPISKDMSTHIHMCIVTFIQMGTHVSKHVSIIHMSIHTPIFMPAHMSVHMSIHVHVHMRMQMATCI